MPVTSNPSAVCNQRDPCSSRPYMPRMNPSAMDTMPTIRATIAFVLQLVGTVISSFIMEYATTGGVAGSTPLGTDFASLLVDRARLLASAELTQDVGQFLERFGHLWMRQSQRLLPDRECLAIKGLRLRRLPLCNVQLSEVRSAEGDVGMVASQELFLDGQRPHQQRLGFRVLPVHAMKDAEIVQGRRDISVRLAMHGLIDLQRLQIQGLRLNMFTLSGIDLCQLR